MQHGTVFAIVWSGVMLLAWEAFVLYRRRTDATISWVTLMLSLAHPLIAFLWCVLTAHFFWPRCGHFGEQVVDPRVGYLLAIGAIVVLLWELVHRISVPTIKSVPVTYPVRLALIALFGVAIGHYVFGQYVECGT